MRGQSRRLVLARHAALAVVACFSFASAGSAPDTFIVPLAPAPDFAHPRDTP